MLLSNFQPSSWKCYPVTMNSSHLTFFAKLTQHCWTNYPMLKQSWIIVVILRCGIIVVAMRCIGYTMLGSYHNAIIMMYVWWVFLTTTSVGHGLWIPLIMILLWVQRVHKVGRRHWGVGGHAPFTFCVVKRKKGNKGKQEKLFKQSFLKRCDQGQNVTVSAIPERLEFKNFPCQPTMVAGNSFQCSMAASLWNQFHRPWYKFLCKGFVTDSITRNEYSLR